MENELSDQDISLSNLRIIFEEYLDQQISFFQSKQSQQISQIEQLTLQRKSDDFLYDSLGEGYLVVFENNDQKPWNAVLEDEIIQLFTWSINHHFLENTHQLIININAELKDIKFTINLFQNSKEGLTPQLQQKIMNFKKQLIRQQTHANSNLSQKLDLQKFIRDYSGFQQFDNQQVVMQDEKPQSLAEYQQKQQLQYQNQQHFNQQLPQQHQIGTQLEASKQKNLVENMISDESDSNDSKEESKQPSLKQTTEKLMQFTSEVQQQIDLFSNKASKAKSDKHGDVSEVNQLQQQANIQLHQQPLQLLFTSGKKNTQDKYQLETPLFQKERMNDSNSKLNKNLINQQVQQSQNKQGNKQQNAIIYNQQQQQLPQKEQIRINKIKRIAKHLYKSEFLKYAMQKRPFSGKNDQKHKQNCDQIRRAFLPCDMSEPHKKKCYERNVVLCVKHLYNK